MDTLLHVLSYAVVAYTAYTVGIHIASLRIMTKMVNDPDSVAKLVTELKNIRDDNEVDVSDAIEVQTEQVNGLVYAYNKATGEFLAQDQNLQQVMLLAAQRYPGKKFWHPELTKDTQTIC
jgi:hypothetical protein